MKLYFSGLGGTQQFILDYVKTFPVQRALASFALPRQLDKLLKNGFTSIFLDSGAYSVFNSGVEINIDSFIDFAKEHRGELDAIASLDVLGDPEGSLANYKYTIKRGLDVWPTYHFGEPDRILQEYVENTNCICVGGVAGTGIHPTSIAKNLWFIMTRYPGLNIHVFGVNCFDVLMPIPIYSVDALTWRSGSRFGDVFINGKRYKAGRTARDSTYNQVAEWLMEHANLDIKDPEFDFKQLDLWNLRSLFDILETEHSQRDFSGAVAPTLIF